MSKGLLVRGRGFQKRLLLGENGEGGRPLWLTHPQTHFEFKAALNCEMLKQFKAILLLLHQQASYPFCSPTNQQLHFFKSLMPSLITFHKFLFGCVFDTVFMQLVFDNAGEFASHLPLPYESSVSVQVTKTNFITWICSNGTSKLKDSLQ